MSTSFNQENIGQNIFYYRTKLGYTQKKLQVFVLGRIGNDCVLNWELGKTYPNIKNLTKLCEVLQCTPNDLLGEKKYHSRKGVN